MQEQPMTGGRPDRPRSEEELDNLVLGVVLDGPSLLWSIDEIARELADRVLTEDAVARLTAAGLLHRIQEFVFATRTAVRANELQIGTI